MRAIRGLAMAAALALAVAACADGSAGADAGAGGAGGTAGTGGDGGSGGTAGAGGNTTGTWSCDDLGLPVRPFTEGASGSDFDTVVQNFTLQTLEGPWNLAERWSGCDAYVFVLHAEGSAFSEQLLGSAVKVGKWLELSPRNVQYFFLPYTDDPTLAASWAEAARTNVEAGIARLVEADEDAWRARIHFVTEPVATAGGWVGPKFLSWSCEGCVDTGDGPDTSDYQAFGFAIDRFQVLRELGYPVDPSNGTAAVRMLAREAERFNFEAEREARLAGENATVLRAFDAVPTADPGYTLEGIYADVVFPDAATMAGFDTLELDLTLSCGGHPELPRATYSANPELATCSLWDSNVDVFLCDVDDPQTTDVDESARCDRLMARWITPYARGGRWVVDASHFLAAIDGGTRRIKLYSQVNTIDTLDIRLRNAGKPARPFAMVELWDDATVETRVDGVKLEAAAGRFTPVSFTPPEGVTKVEVRGMVSGHGGSSDVLQCAEFCNHEHAFSLNDGPAVWKSHPEADITLGCEETVGEGTMPNQYGTWVYGRGGWCPGNGVATWSADLTGSAFSGGENVLEYAVTVGGEAYVPRLRPGFTQSDNNLNYAWYLVFSKAP